MKQKFFTGCLALSLAAASAHAQSTAFSYQGRLNASSGPATGLYDFHFSLYATSNSIPPVTLTNYIGPVPVTNGLFTVALDFGGGTFTGADRWLEIGVRTNGGGLYVTLAPRQFLAPTPYAIRAASAVAAVAAGVATNVASGGVNNAALATGAVDSSKIADGSIATSDLSLAVLSNTFWRLTGNAGTTAGTHFLGTADNQPVEIKVNGLRGLRLEPHTNFGTVSIVGGAAVNSASGQVGATIAGGGTSTLTNRVTGPYGTVGGGIANLSGDTAAVGGGFDNQATGTDSAIAGGGNNRASGTYSSVGGGLVNFATNSYSTVPGGRFNVAGGPHSLAAGRRAQALHDGTFAWGDATDANFPSTASNQFLIRASGGVGVNTNNPQDALHVHGSYLRVNGPGGEAAYLGGGGAGTRVYVGSVNPAVSNVMVFNRASGLFMDFLARNLQVEHIFASGSNGVVINGPLRLNDSNLWLRGGPDMGHGLGWHGGSKTFGGYAPDGPVLFGHAGGVLGTTQGGQTNVLTWNSAGRVGIGTNAPQSRLHVNGVVTATALQSDGYQPLELKVNGVRALRMEPTLNDASHSDIVNMIGGSPANVVGPGVYGATIAGGGAVLYGLPSPNQVLADFGTIGGGTLNAIGLSAVHATIGGGTRNKIHNGSFDSTIAGGRDNRIGLDTGSTISGGTANVIQTNGYGNTIAGGGYSRIADNASYATIGGGNEHYVGGFTIGSTVAGGDNNSVGGVRATVGGGHGNISGGHYATIPGGAFNRADGSYSFAAGQHANASHNGAFVWADSFGATFDSTGSNQFLIRASGGVGIGKPNPASALDVNGGIRARGGPPGGLGSSNNGYAFSGNSGDNDSGMFSSADGQVEFYGNSAERMRIHSNGQVAIGTTNPEALLHVKETGQDVVAVESSAAGGTWTSLKNTSTGGKDWRTISTGSGNSEGPGHLLLFVDGSRRFEFRANGDFITTGTVNPPSDRNVKRDFAPANPLAVLEKVARLQIQTWAYTNDTAIRHIGPMAQDFHAAFGLGTDERHIATVDADGVALAAIQGLNQKVNDKDVEIRDLKARLASLETLVQKLAGPAAP